GAVRVRLLPRGGGRVFLFDGCYVVCRGVFVVEEGGEARNEENAVVPGTGLLEVTAACRLSPVSALWVTFRHGQRPQETRLAVDRGRADRGAGAVRRIVRADRVAAFEGVWQHCICRTRIFPNSVTLDGLAHWEFRSCLWR